MNPDKQILSVNQPLWKVITYPIGELILFFIIISVVQGGVMYALSVPAFFDLGEWKSGINLLTAALIASTVAISVSFLAIRRVSWEKSPMGLKDCLSDTVVGFLIGIAIISGVVLVLLVTGFFTINGLTDFGSGSVWSFMATNLIFFLGVAIFEEVLFRAGMFHLIESWWGSAAALAISAVFFGLVHLGNPQSTWLGAIAIAFEAGILLGAVYMMTRKIWMVTGIHWSWNFFQGPVYGSVISGSSSSQVGLLDVTISGPEWISGGQFGLEASIVAIVLATGTGIGFLFLAIKKGQWIPFPNSKGNAENQSND